jgi:hypothetical protein
VATVYLDHNVSRHVAPDLRLLGHHAVTAHDLGLQFAGDDAHLIVAWQMRWVLLTHNAKDFYLLHDAWRRWSGAWRVTEVHPGIVVSPVRPPTRVAQEADALLRSGLPLLGELYTWPLYLNRWNVRS